MSRPSHVYLAKVRFLPPPAQKAAQPFAWYKIGKTRRPDPIIRLNEHLNSMPCRLTGYRYIAIDKNDKRSDKYHEAYLDQHWALEELLKAALHDERFRLNRSEWFSGPKTEALYQELDLLTTMPNAPAIYLPNQKELLQRTLADCGVAQFASFHEDILLYQWGKCRVGWIHKALERNEAMPAFAAL